MAYRNRSRGEGAFQLNLTPLLDVVLQLITFFMMLIHFGTKIEGAAIDACGSVRFRHRVATPAQHYRGTIDAIIALIDID